MLEERNQGGGDRDQLLRRHVHVVDVRRRLERQVTTLTRQHEIIHERAVRVELRVGLRDDGVFFTVGIEPHQLARHLAFLDHAIRRLDETEIVHAGKAGERRDQADVRTFRRLDGAHAPVLRIVHVTDFEAGTLAREAARSKRRQTTFMRQFGERIGLIHELRQLGGSEERLNHGRDRARVHEIVERNLFRIGVDRHALFDQSRHARQPNRELIGDQLADRADTTVAQLIDIVHIAAAFMQLDELTHDLDEVFLREHGGRHRGVEAQALIDLVPTDTTKVIALRREEQPLERLLGRFTVRRIARTEQRIDLFERFVLMLRRVLRQRVLDQRRLGATRRDKDVHLGGVGLADLLDHGVGEDRALFGHFFARLRIDHVARERATHVAFATIDRVLLIAQIDLRVRGEDLDRIDALPHEAVEHFIGQFIAFAHEQRRFGTLAFELRFLGLRLRRVVGGDFAIERDVFGDDRAEQLTLLIARLTLHREIELPFGEEQAQNVAVLAVAEGAQQRRRGELLLLVDVDVDHIVDVHGELDPRAAERNDPR